MIDLVADASVAVKWLVREEDTAAANRILAARADLSLYAPRLLASEVANALWSKVRRGELPPDPFRDAAASIRDLPLIWFDDESLAADAGLLAVELASRPTTACTSRWRGASGRGW